MEAIRVWQRVPADKATQGKANEAWLSELVVLVVNAFLKVALLGAGAMGANHARVIAGSPRARLEVIVDHHLDRANRLASHAGCAAASSIDAASGCHATILATPSEAHVQQALQLLAVGQPLLIEKPIAVDPVAVREVLGQADARGIPITCGFVERFNPAISTALSLLDEPPLHLVGIRHSPHTPRVATSVVFDMLIHDIDLAFRFGTGAEVRNIQGACWNAPSGIREIADCTIEFSDGMLATLSASRYSQRKIRTLWLATSRILIEVDLLRANVSVYRNVRQEQLTDTSTTYRAETIVDIPFVRHAGEPLALQFDHFLDLVEGKADRKTEWKGLLPPHEVASRVDQGVHS